MNNEQRIAALYGDNADTISADLSGSSVNVSATDAAPRLYREHTPAKNPYSLEPESIEAKLYADTDTLQLDRETEANIELLSDTDAGRIQWRTVLGFLGSTLGATQDDIHFLVNSVISAQIGVPGTDHTTALEELVNEIGPAEATRKIAKAKELVDSVPDLKRLLNTNGMGNNPALIRRFIRLAEAPRGQHRIQTLRKLRTR